MSDTSRYGLPRREFVASSAAMAFLGAASAPAGSAEAAPQHTGAKGPAGGESRLHPDLQPIAILPDRTALMVIDMQRYFVRPDFPFGKATARSFPEGAPQYFKRLADVVVPNCQKLQKAFRAAKASIVYTAFGSVRNDGLDMPRWARKINVIGRDSVGKALFPPFKDPSCQVDDSLAPAPDEFVLFKPSSGPLNSSKLDQMFRTLGIDTLVVTGVVTEICVTQTAREFADRDFKVIVVEDACASMVQEHHKAALEIFGGCFGEVATTNKVVEDLAKGRIGN